MVVACSTVGGKILIRKVSKLEERCEGLLIVDPEVHHIDLEAFSLHFSHSTNSSEPLSKQSSA